MYRPYIIGTPIPIFHHMANICNVRIGNTATEIAVAWAGAKVGAKSLGAFGAWTGGLVGGAGAVPGVG